MEAEREELEAQKQKELEAQRKELEKANRARRNQKSYIDKGVDSMLGTITRTIGREIARGILGSIKKK